MSTDHAPGAPTAARADLARVALVALAAAIVWFLPCEPWTDLGLAATLIGGYPIFTEAVKDPLARRMTMELSMTIGLVAALVVGEVFTGCWSIPAAPSRWTDRASRAPRTSIRRPWLL